MTKQRGVDLGGQIRKLREAQGLSLKAVADQTGMSYSYLWGLERNKHSISVVNLQRLSAFFNVDLAYFFQTKSEESVVFVGKDETTKYFTEDGLVFNLITPGQVRNIQALEIFHPPYTPSERRVYRHKQKGQELITVLEGLLFVVVENKKYRLEKGDSLVFNSDLEHTIYTEAEAARFFLVASPPYGHLF